jgi:SAM-dependent methyltransferase
MNMQKEKKLPPEEGARDKPMPNYLETNYFRDEYDENAYPQKLCDYLIKRYVEPTGGVAGKRCLDIGSGKGNHLVGLARRGIEAFGIDRRTECVEILEQFDIRDCDLEKGPFPFEDSMFDVVLSKSVIEHVRNTDNVLSEALRVLRPGGTAIFLTPDWASQRAFFWDDYTHVKPFTRKGLQNAMRINGYTGVTCEYFLQLPFVWTQPWLSLLPKLLGMLPASWKWRDREESSFRALIRFSQEKMLLATGSKSANRSG